MRYIKKEKLKKERKIISEKVYLKKGYYALNDIYYYIFQDTNDQYCFSFVNKQGRTVLLNESTNGFSSFGEAEAMINQILVFAQEKNRFEIKTASDGKFYLILFNDKGDKIGKSFYFRTRKEIENSLQEFISGNASTNIGFASSSINKHVNNIQSADIIPISQNAIDEKRNLELRKEEAANLAIEERKKIELSEKIRLEEKRKRQEEKEKKAKELEVMLAAKKEQRKKEKAIKEKERIEAAKINASRDPMKDDDLFDGCFRWLWIILILLLLALLFSYFKGCFGNIGDQANSRVDDGNTNIIDSENREETNETKEISSIAEKQPEEKTASKNNSRINNNQTDNKNADSKNAGVINKLNGDSSNPNKTRVQSDGYQNNLLSVANCDCGSKADVFKMPNGAPKTINKLGTNPQFGNTHGLSASDFLEDLKYRYDNNSWDRSYLNYLYKAMGYNGFQDATASQFSQEKINPKSKGILGFGTYSGYAYSELDLQGKDLEVFRVEAANGCHINFMKTCGNLFFMCQ